jgi:hypothetical protein
MAHTWTEIITAVGTVLGAVFTALGLGFIVVQLRAARRQLTITTFEHLYSGMQDIHKVFIEKPYLRPFFYEGKPLKEGANNPEEIYVVAEMLADFFQQVCLELDLMPPKTAQGWRAYISDIIGRSPTLRVHLKSNAAWYPSQLLILRRGRKENRMLVLWTTSPPYCPLHCKPT